MAVGSTQAARMPSHGRFRRMNGYGMAACGAKRPFVSQKPEDDRFKSYPRNHPNLRNSGPSGRGFRFEGNRQDSGEVAPNVDLQFAGLRRKDDFLHKRTQDLAGLEPGCLRLESPTAKSLPIAKMAVVYQWRLFVPSKLVNRLISGASHSSPGKSRPLLRTAI